MSLPPPPVGVMQAMPLQGEMTASRRSYGQACTDLLRAVMGQRFPELGSVRWGNHAPGSEVLVNGPAMARLAVFPGLPQVPHDRLPALRSPDGYLPRITRIYLAWGAPRRPWIIPGALGPATLCVVRRARSKATPAPAGAAASQRLPHSSSETGIL
ncbi:hypothetical protein ABZ214_26940 [Streptomyces iakyrus]|uniref:hypothetical protein n=1 Tax=Streptomyces iakyrus TaxID=68219 RepID=UPI0033BC32E1